MVVVGYLDDRCRVYSFPGLKLMYQLSLGYSRSPRADRDGTIFVPSYRNITLLEISGTGKMTVLRNLTAGGWGLLYPSVATGLEADLLCVATRYPPALLIVNITEDRVVRAMELPEPCQRIFSVAALATGEVLIFYLVDISNSSFTGSFALYGSVSEPPTLLTNMTSERDFVRGLLGTGNRFLVLYNYSGELLVVAPDGSVLHDIEALTGKLGIWLYIATDVAVWQDCLWMVGFRGDMFLLC